MLSEGGQDLVQERRQYVGGSSVIQQIRNCAKQVAKKIAGPRLRRDIEHNLIQMDHEAKQVQIKRPQVRVKYLATTRHGQGRRYRAQKPPRSFD